MKISQNVIWAKTGFPGRREKFKIEWNQTYDNFEMRKIELTYYVTKNWFLWSWKFDEKNFIFVIVTHRGFKKILVVKNFHPLTWFLNPDEILFDSGIRKCFNSTLGNNSKKHKIRMIFHYESINLDFIPEWGWTPFQDFVYSDFRDFNFQPKFWINLFTRKSGFLGFSIWIRSTTRIKSCIEKTIWCQSF